MGVLEVTLVLWVLLLVGQQWLGDRHGGRSIGLSIG